MGAFYDPAWVAAAADEFGDACRLRLLVRDKANALLDLTATETVIAVNPIYREIERGVGIMQGQTWDVELTYTGATTLPAGGLDDCWCQLRGKIGAIEAPLATGRIRGFSTCSDRSMRFRVEDPLVAIVNARFPRDVGWYSNGYAGFVHSLDASGRYDNNWDPDGNLVGVQRYAGNEFRLRDTSYTITFTTGVAFTVRDDTDETGEYTTNGTIDADTHVASSYDPTNFVVTIKADGWDDEAGAYAAGDTFTFSTSAPRTGSQRSPVSLLADLIELYAGLSVMNVLTGEVWDSPRYDAAWGSGYWWDAYQATISQYWAGHFQRDDDVVRAIQGILRVLNWALYCAPDGRIALYRPVPGAVSQVALRGDWASGAVNVLRTERTETMEWVANVVRYSCLDASGRDENMITVESADADSLYGRIVKEFEIPWIVPFGALRAGASQTLARLKRARELFNSRTTFAGASMLPGELFTLHDPDGSAVSELLTAFRVRVDPISESAEVTGFRDVLTGAGFFIIGGPDTVPVGSRIGGSGDPGAAPLW